MEAKCDVRVCLVCLVSGVLFVVVVVVVFFVVFVGPVHNKLMRMRIIT